MAVVNIESSDVNLENPNAPAGPTHDDSKTSNSSGVYQELPAAPAEPANDGANLPLQPTGANNDNVLSSPPLPARNVVHAEIRPALPATRNDENADHGQDPEVVVVNIESTDVDLNNTNASEGPTHDDSKTSNSSGVYQEIPDDGDGPFYHVLLRPALPARNDENAEMDDSNVAPAEPTPLPLDLPKIGSLPRASLASGPVAEPESSGVCQDVPAAPAGECVYVEMYTPLRAGENSAEHLAQAAAAPVAEPEPCNVKVGSPSQDGLNMSTVNIESSIVYLEIPAAHANDSDSANLPLQPAGANDNNVLLSPALPARNVVHAEMDDSNVAHAEPAPLPFDLPKIGSLPRANLASGSVAEQESSGVGLEIPAAPAECVYVEMRSPLLAGENSAERLAQSAAAPVAWPEPCNVNVGSTSQDSLEMSAVNIDWSGVSLEIQAAPANDGDGVNLLPLQPAERNVVYAEILPALPPKRNEENVDLDDSNVAPAEPAPLPPDLPKIGSLPMANLAQPASGLVTEPENSSVGQEIPVAPAEKEYVYVEMRSPLQAGENSAEHLAQAAAAPVAGSERLSHIETAPSQDGLEMAAVNNESSCVYLEIVAAPANNGNGANLPLQPAGTNDDLYLPMRPILPSLPTANRASRPVVRPENSGVSQEIPAAPAEYVYVEMRSPLLERENSAERLAQAAVAPVAWPEPCNVNVGSPSQDGLEMSTVNIDWSGVSLEIQAAPANDGDGANLPLQPAGTNDDLYLPMRQILPSLPTANRASGPVVEQESSGVCQEIPAAPAEPANDGTNLSLQPAGTNEDLYLPMRPISPSLPRARLASRPVAEQESSGVGLEIPAAPAECVYVEMRSPLQAGENSAEHLAQAAAAPVAWPEPCNVNVGSPSQDGMEMSAVNIDWSGVSLEIQAAPANDGDGANLSLQRAGTNEDIYLPMRPILPSLPRANLASGPVVEPESSEVGQEIRAAPAEPANDGANLPLQPAGTNDDLYFPMRPISPSLPRTRLASGPVVRPENSDVGQDIPAAPAGECVYVEMRSPLLARANSAERLAQAAVAPVAWPEPCNVNVGSPSQDGMEMSAVNIDWSGVSLEIQAAPANDGDSANLPLQPAGTNEDIYLPMRPILPSLPRANLASVPVVEPESSGVGQEIPDAPAEPANDGAILPLQPAESNNDNVPLSPALPAKRNDENAEMDDSNPSEGPTEKKVNQKVPIGCPRSVTRLPPVGTQMGTHWLYRMSNPSGTREWSCPEFGHQMGTH
ncbi:uncharacterized protein LOC135936032 [Cloeon dipterum]|uniref:uncharacterized protein LOC135936032 n=1 Tax=Cloeon dipterum TaxID=197152 RepID=UPI00322075CE